MRVDLPKHHLRNAQTSNLPRFVAFFGPDGAGKSTHVRLLTAYYRSRGQRVKTAWIRGNHTFAWILSTFLIRMGYYGVSPHPMRTFDPGDTFGRSFSVSTLPALKPLWRLIEFVSVVPLIMTRVYIPLSLGYAVVAERYIVDVVVTVSRIVDDPKFIESTLSKVILRFVPKNARMIYLYADYDSILERRREEVHSREFIEFQIQHYDILARRLGYPKICTSNKTIAQTQALIRQVVGE